jgi:hypothetical protein
LESELPRSRNTSSRSGCQTSRRICILRHLCHVESEKQTDIQAAGLCERPGVSCSCRGRCSPSANNNMSKSSHKYIHKRPAVTRFCALVGAPFSGLSMRIFLLRARSTSPHTSMFVRHTPLGLSRKGWCLHRPNSGRGERGPIPPLVGVQRAGLAYRSHFHSSLCCCIISSCC